MWKKDAEQRHWDVADFTVCLHQTVYVDKFTLFQEAEFQEWRWYRLCIYSLKNTKCKVCPGSDV